MTEKRTALEALIEERDALRVEVDRLETAHGKQLYRLTEKLRVYREERDALKAELELEQGALKACGSDYKFKINRANKTNADLRAKVKRLEKERDRYKAAILEIRGYAGDDGDEFYELTMELTHKALRLNKPEAGE